MGILGKEFVGSLVEQLKCRDNHRHGLGLKPTSAILLCPWERHFTALFPCLVLSLLIRGMSVIFQTHLVHSPAWWSWQAVLNFSHISLKFQLDSNILASPEAARGNRLPNVLAPPSLFHELGG